MTLKARRAVNWRIIERGGDLLQVTELTRRIVDLLTEKQAEDVVVLNISQTAPFADYFVIASGQTARQIQALLKSLDEDLGRDGVHPLRREGKAASGWVLLDFGDVVVHVFAPEQRRYYDLEALWSRVAPTAPPSM